MALNKMVRVHNLYDMMQADCCFHVNNPELIFSCKDIYSLEEGYEWVTISNDPEDYMEKENGSS